MANLNKVMLIGRLTRDPEMRTFSNGGRVAAFGFAVNNRKKNQATGEWEDEPCFLDCKAFNRGENGRKLADLVEQYLFKGHQAYLEGHLVMEQWEKDGQKRSKLVVVIDDLQFLERKQDGSMGGSSERADNGGGYRKPAPTSSAPQRRPAAPAYSQDSYDEPEPDGVSSGPKEDEIPF